MIFNSNALLGDKSVVQVSKEIKIIILMVLLFTSFGLFALKLFSMQVFEGEVYRSRSATISSRSRVIPAQRGEIYDRYARTPLVANTDSFAVDLIPGEIPKGQYDTVAMRLAGFLGISKPQIDGRVPVSMRSSFSSIEIKSNVPFPEISNIAENIIDLPGVSWRSKPVRSYIAGGSMSHIIGYVGDITRDELKVLFNRGYTHTSVVGKTGIEKQYDELLQGKAGSESQAVDVRGRLIPGNPLVVTPETGRNLVLTIDSRIQTLTEKALGNHTGAAIVLNAGTGEILAMVSYPYFDANEINSGRQAVFLSDSENKSLLNRAVNAVYPPASTFKTIMTSALLNENVVPKERPIDCTGQITYGGRFFHCHVWPRRHGPVDLKNGLAQSCDVYFWTVGRENLGIDLIYQYANDFGIGRPLKIDLPSVSAGFMPTAEWKERRFHEKWLGGDTMNISIGQGYTLVTPLHVANMMAMVVNSGTIYRPHILKEVRSPSGNEIFEEIKPEVLHQTDSISPEVWRTVQSYLRYTVTDGAVVNTLRNRVVEIAGKTGTGEVAQYDDKWHSWWVGYGPYNAPSEQTLVVCVLMETLTQSQLGAPYVANIIFQGIFADQTYDQAIDTLGFRYALESEVNRP
jgi:penicillin-binding protein 2